MADTLGTLVVRIAADIKELESGLDQAGEKTRTTAASMQASLGGVSQATIDLQNKSMTLTKSQVDAANATAGSTRQTVELSNEMQRLLARYDPLGTKLRSLQSDYAALNKAMDAGNSRSGLGDAFDKTIVGLNADMDKTASLMKVASAGTVEAGVSMAGFGLNTQMARRELMMLGREALTGDFSRMPQTFGSLVAHSNLVQVALSPVGAIVMGITASVAALGYAIYKSEESAKAFNLIDNALAATGRSADISRSMVEGMLNELERAPGITKDMADKSVMAFAKTMDIGAGLFQNLTDMLGKYAEFTGQEAPKAAEALAKMFSDPAKAAEELSKAYGMLDPDMVRHIETLQAQGRFTEAQQILLDAWKNTLGEIPPNLTEIGTASLALKNSWQDMTQSMGESQGMKNTKSDLAAVIGMMTWVISHGSAVVDVYSKNLFFRAFSTPQTGGASGSWPGGSGATGAWGNAPVTASSSAEQLNKDTVAALAQGKAYAGVAQQITDLNNVKIKFQGVIDANNKATEAGTVATGTYAKANAELTLDIDGITKKIADLGKSHIKANTGLSEADKGLVEYNALIAKSAGLNANFATEWDKLSAAYKGGKITVDELTIAQAELLKEQTFSKDIVKQAADAAKEYAKAQAEQAKAIAAMENVGQKEIKSLDEKIAKQTQVNDQMGMTKAQIDALNSTKQLQSATDDEVLAGLYREAAVVAGPYHDAYIQYAIDLEETAKKKRTLAGLDSAAGVKQAGLDTAKKVNEEWKHGWEETDRIGRETFIGLTVEGKTFAETVGKSLKTSVAGALYDLFARPIFLQVYTSLTGGAGGSGSAGNTLGNVAGMKSLYEIANGPMSIGGMTGAFAKSGMGQSMGLSTPVMTDTSGVISNEITASGQAWSQGMTTAASVLGYADAFSAAAGGRWGEAAGEAIGTYIMPGVGTLIGKAIGKALDEAFAGEMRAGGQYAYSVASGTTFAQGPSGGQIMGADVQKAITATVGTINNLLTGIGSAARLTGFQAGLEMSTDSRGGVFAGGTFSTGATFGESGKGSNYNGTLYEKTSTNSPDAQTALANFTTDLTQATLEALQAATDIPKTISDMLKGQDIEALTAQASTDLLNTIDAVVATVVDFNAAAKTLPFEALKNLSFDTAAGLIAAAGGMQTLGANLATYYDKFYSPLEKTALLTKNTTDAFAAIGIVMPKVDDSTRAWYRSEVERLGAMDLGVQANAAAYTSALALAGAVDTLAPVAAAATAAVDAYAAAIKSAGDKMTSDAASLAADLMRAQGNTRGGDLLALGITDPNKDATTIAVVAQYDANTATRTWIQTLTDTAAVTDSLNATGKSLQDQWNRLNMTESEYRDTQIVGMTALQVAQYDTIASIQTSIDLRTAENAAIKQTAIDLQTAISSMTSTQTGLASKYANPLDLAGAKAALPGLADTLLAMSSSGIRTAITDYIKALDPMTQAGRDAIAQVNGLSGALDVLVGAVDKAAAAADAIAAQRYGLDTKLLTLQGNTVELRRRELALIDPANQAIQESIWALQDATTAQQNYNTALSTAKSNLTSAQSAFDSAQSAVQAIQGEGTTRYLNTLSAVETAQQRVADVQLKSQTDLAAAAAATAKQMLTLGDQLHEFVAGAALKPDVNFGRLLAKAMGGDQQAMGSLPGAITAAIDAEKLTAASAFDFARAQAKILQQANAAADYATSHGSAGAGSTDTGVADANTALARAQADLADALRVANAINAPLAASAADLIGRYTTAVGALTTATTNLSAMQIALDAIAVNTAATVTGVNSLGQALTVEMTISAKSEIEKLITYIGNTDNLSEDLQKIALLQSSEITKTISIVAGASTLTDTQKQLALIATGDVTKTIATIAGSNTLTATQAALALTTTDAILKSISTAVGTTWLTGNDLSLALQATSAVTKTFNAALGAQDATAITLAEAASSVITKIINASGGVLTDDQRTILTAAASATAISITTSGTVTFQPDNALKSVFDNISASNNILTKLALEQLVLFTGVDWRAAPTTTYGVERTNLAQTPESYSQLYQLSTQTSYQSQMVGYLAAIAAHTNDGMLIKFARGAAAGVDVYAAGGAFTNGIATGPTYFNKGLMGEGGQSEAIMPLANINGSLGVRFAGNSANGALVAEIRASREEAKLLREELKDALAKLEASSERGNESANRTANTLDGQQRRPILVEIAQ